MGDGKQFPWLSRVSFANADILSYSVDPLHSADIKRNIIRQPLRTQAENRQKAINGHNEQSTQVLMTPKGTPAINVEPLLEAQDSHRWKVTNGDCGRLMPVTVTPEESPVPISDQQFLRVPGENRRKVTNGQNEQSTRVSMTPKGPLVAVEPPLEAQNPKWWEVANRDCKQSTRPGPPIGPPIAISCDEAAQFERELTSSSRDQSVGVRSQADPPLSSSSYPPLSHDYEKEVVDGIHSNNVQNEDPACRAGPSFDGWPFTRQDLITLKFQTEISNEC